MTDAIVIDKPWEVGPWVAERADFDWTPSRVAASAGLYREGELLAGAVYEDFNGYNIVMHFAAVPTRRWMSRGWLHYVFWYPFCAIGASRITGLVAESNAAARAFDEHVGFTLEAALVRGMGPKEDLLVYRMFREECRWLTEAERSGERIH